MATEEAEKREDNKSVLLPSSPLGQSDQDCFFSARIDVLESRVKVQQKVRSHIVMLKKWSTTCLDCFSREHEDCEFHLASSAGESGVLYCGREERERRKDGSE